MQLIKFLYVFYIYFHRENKTSFEAQLFYPANLIENTIAQYCHHELRQILMPVYRNAETSELCILYIYILIRYWMTLSVCNRN